MGEFLGDDKAGLRARVVNEASRGVVRNVLENNKRAAKDRSPARLARARSAAFGMASSDLLDDCCIEDTMMEETPEYSLASHGTRGSPHAVHFEVRCGQKEPAIPPDLNKEDSDALPGSVATNSIIHHVTVAESVNSEKSETSSTPD